MRNDKDNQYEQIENLLGKAHLSGPSSELKDRINVETTRLWNQSSVEVPWQIPIRRLVASVAAAVFVIWLANVTSDYSVARWKTSGSSEMRQQLPELEILSEISYVKHLTSISRGFPATDASGLHHYIEMVRKLLDEAPQDGISNPTDPAKGRSRLLPARSNPSSYS